MTTANPSTTLVLVEPIFSEAERLALSGYLAGYSGLTREAYALDLRQFTVGVSNTTFISSKRTAPTFECSVATSKLAVEREQRFREDFVPSQVLSLRS